MSNKIAVIFASDCKELGTNIAKSCRGLGEVIVAPTPILDFESAASISSVFALDNRAIFCVVSQKFIRELKDYSSQLITRVKDEQANIVILSADDEWKQIVVEEAKFLNSRIYENVSNNRIDDFDFKSYCGKKIRDISAQLRVYKSHFDSNSFRTLIKVNFPTAQIEFTDLVIGNRIYGCYASASIDRTKITYLAIFPDSSQNEHLAIFKTLLEEDFPDILQDSAKIVVRSRPISGFSSSAVLDAKERFNASDLVRFETKLNGLRFFPDELAKPQALPNPSPDIPQKWRRNNNNEIVEESVLQSYLMDASVNWQSKPIVFLEGAGGGGKTHYISKFYNACIRDRKDVFFIEGTAPALSGPKFNGRIKNLYDVYQYVITLNGNTEPVSKEIFELKYLVENVIIIIDGLEEISTRLGENFDSLAFFSDCAEKYSKNAEGRLIITTRQAPTHEDIESFSERFEIELFQEEQTVQFFGHRFQDNKMSKLALNACKKATKGEALIPPFICHLIAELVTDNEIREDEISERESGNIDDDTDMSGNGLGYLVSKFLLRDKKHKIYWTKFQLEESLELLAREIALKQLVSLETAIEIWAKIVPELSKTTLSSQIKSFNLLNYSSTANTISFRYDFMKSFYLSRYFYRSITDPELPIVFMNAADDDLKLLKQSLKPNSPAMLELEAEISNHDFIRDMDMSEQLYNRICEILPLMVQMDDYDKEVVSNLFYLAIKAGSQNDKAQTPTEIAQSIFNFQQNKNSKKVIRRMSIISFGGGGDSDIRFDFSNQTLEDCSFRQIRFGNMVKINEETKFKECSFENCGDRIDRRFVNSNTFINCEYDEQFSENVSSVLEKKENIVKRQREFARHIFLFFFNNGRFHIVRKEALIVEISKNNSSVSGNEIITKCIKIGLIKDRARDGDQNKLEVRGDQQASIMNFLKNDIANDEILQLLSYLRRN